mgnify:FL=1
MTQGHWNRSGRRAGGTRPARLVVPTLTADEARIMTQRERIRTEFGEDGVRRFDTALLDGGRIEDHVVACTNERCAWSGKASVCLMTVAYHHLCPACAAVTEPVEGPWGEGA